MNERESIGKRLRFEVFKPDRFTCQYCGAKAPEVILHVDHLNPVAEGGTNDLLNLITACSSCNLGKGARRLEDSTAIEKQRTQLEELQERRDQLQMMVDWQHELLALDTDVVQQVADFWTTLVGFNLTDAGRGELAKWIKRFSVTEVMEAMRVACDTYYEPLAGQDERLASVSDAFRKVPGICFNRRRSAEDPFHEPIRHVRNVLRRQVTYMNDRAFYPLARQAFDLGASVDSMLEVARSAKSWSAWRDAVEAFIDEQSAVDGEQEGRT